MKDLGIYTRLGGMQMVDQEFKSGAWPSEPTLLVAKKANNSKKK